MTSSSANSDMDSRPARRQLTYGRRARALEISYDIDGSTKAKLKKAATKLTKPQTTLIPPQNVSRQSSLNGDLSVFDVPLSDEEDLRPKPTNGRLKKPLTAVATIESAKQEISSSVTNVAHYDEEASPSSSTAFGKRKREGQVEKSSVHKLSPAAKELALQSNRKSDVFLRTDESIHVGPVFETSSARNIKQPQSKELQIKTRTPATSRQHKKSLSPSIPPVALPSSFIRNLEVINDVPVVISPPKRLAKANSPTHPSEPRSFSTPIKLSGPTPRLTPSTRPSVTPQQSQIWNRLFIDDSQAALEHRISQSPPTLPTLRASTSTHNPVRRRLIDTLLPSSENSRLFEEDEESVSASESHDDEKTPKGALHSQSRSDLAAVSQQSIFLDCGPRRTYAVERSFLQEEATQLEDLLLMPLDHVSSPVAQFRGRRDFGRQSGPTVPEPIDASDEDDGEDDGGMKSIHELRAAGDSQRQDDEVNLLLEDINDGPHSTLSIRRSSSLELSQKLADTGFCDRFIQHGHVRQTFMSCRNVEDPILGTAMLTAMILIITTPTSRHTASQLLEVGVLELITRMLSFEKDVLILAKDRKNNMSKSGQDGVRDFKAFIGGSTWWQVAGLSVVVSPQLVALKGFDALVRKLRETGHMEQILGPKLAGILLEVLHSLCQQISSKPTFLSKDVTSPLTIVLSILESHTVSQACALDRTVWTTGRLQKLVEQIYSILKLQCDASTIIHCLGLRICLNLANNSKRNSEAFAKPELISTMLSMSISGLASISEDEVEDEEPRSFDVLVLSLGALINLAEWSEKVRTSVLDSEAKQLMTLLDLFIQRRKIVSSVESLVESHANVAYGYLSVLLGNLCSSSALKSTIQSRLPGGQLVVLVEAVDEFIAHHKVVDGREQGTEVWAAFTDRLQTVSNSLKQIT